MRREHDFDMEVLAERCSQCECTVEAIPTIGTWNPDAPPRPFNWSVALVTFLMEIEEGQGLYTDTIHRWRPKIAVQSDEIEELRAIELVVRDLWNRYAPPKIAPTHRLASVAAENAAVDEYEAKKNELMGVLLRLAVTDEWKSYFPESEHPRIERAKQVIIRRGGGAV